MRETDNQPSAPAHKLALLGWYGSSNTGDEAVLEAIVSALRQRGIADIHAFSINPSKTAKLLSISSSTRNPFSPATLGTLRRSEALILGGGGLIQDRTSVYNLPLYALYVLIARILGLKVVGWGLGVEPLDTRLGKLLARFICGSSARFSVRDDGARRLLVAAGVNSARITVSADPAFLLESPRGEDQPSRAATGGPADNGSKPVVVFCLRDLPDNRPGFNPHYLLPISLRRRLGFRLVGNTERTGAFITALARAVRLCAQELGADVDFLALWPGRDDAVIARVILAAQALGVPRDAMRVVEVPGSASHVVPVVRRADLLVSMRLHALVFAAGGGVPMLALAYARKMRGVMRLLGAERWLVEVETEIPPPDEIEAKLRLLWAVRKHEGRRASQAAAQARQRAEEDADAVAHILLGAAATD
jgi:polysaccharide pyruvyl transferase WcaK-like protein